MDTKTDEKGEKPGAGSDTRPSADSPATEELEATGDAIIIADAILELAASFREVAQAIRAATEPPAEKEEETPRDTYLDGSPIRK